MTELQRVHVDGLQIAYRCAGSGHPVVLLHGWPTSSHLWRHTMAPLADAGRMVIAPDLPGMGGSDKPPEAPYTLDWQAQILDGFLSELGLDRTALVVHDLGGPIGLLWAVRHPERVERLVVLDTIVFPLELPLLRALLGSLRLPGIGALAVHRRGLSALLRLGVVHRHALTETVRRAYVEPYDSPHDGRALLRALLSPRFEEFDELVDGLQSLASVPTLIAWAERDLLLPRSQMRRVARRLPWAETTTIAKAGHFLQEDQPEQVAATITSFLARKLPHDSAGGDDVVTA